MPPKLPAKMPSPPKLPSVPTPDWKHALEVGMQFTELRRSQARSIVSDLVEQGHVARDQMSAAVDDLVDMSRRRSDNLRKVVQQEVQRQLGSLGLATKTDLAALEKRITKASREASKSAAKKSTAKKPAKQATAKKATAKKATAKKAAAKKAAAG